MEHHCCCRLLGLLLFTSPAAGVSPEPDKRVEFGVSTNAVVEGEREQRAFAAAAGAYQWSARRLSLELLVREGRRRSDRREEAATGLRGGHPRRQR
ncbi:hypothetical protein KY285_010829 [Solanum tuberosum]|nr:hypothetical protein KY289_011398 [Solanum tuberosum]KAH0735122.1 hypothetical protein KY285_010829 [Solanum tuberosum]